MKIDKHYCIICLAILLFACKKDTIKVIPEEPKVHPWILDSVQFNSNSALLISTPLNDSVLAVASSSALFYVNVNQLNTALNPVYINNNSVFGQYSQPTLTSEIGVTLLDSHHIKVFSVLSPLSGSGSFTYTPAYTNAQYSNKSFPIVYATGSGYPVINSKYILVPKEINFEAQKAYFSLLQVNQQQQSISLAADKQIIITPESSTLGFNGGNYFSATYYNKFFLSYNGQFFRVDTLGNIKAFGAFPVLGADNGRVEQMFKIGEYLFTAGIGKWFVSPDEGETWTFYLDALGSTIASLKYVNVGNDLYATHLSQIWRVTLLGSDLHFEELDNAGLPAEAQITSINTMGKYTFVTTLSGLYYRDTTSFNTIKQ